VLAPGASLAACRTALLLCRALGLLCRAPLGLEPPALLLLRRAHRTVRVERGVARAGWRARGGDDWDRVRAGDGRTWLALRRLKASAQWCQHDWACRETGAEVLTVRRS
jgi:hypothetical protein